jgi:hypothetical protein
MAREVLPRIALILSLGAALAAQEPLPPLPPPFEDLGFPTLGELLPLRPVVLDEGKDGSVPLRYWGKDVKQTPDGWAMDDGAVESPGLLLLADHIRYRTATGEVEADGHIRLEGPGLRLRCVKLRMDWKRQMGEAWSLDMELPPSWYLKSDKVAFQTMKHWDFEQVELSPCPQEQPGWKAELSRLTVDLDHYAHIRNLWIWIGGVPTPYYLPWAIYPAKAERTSGFLPFNLSFNGPMGASVQAPYYQVLGDTADATLAPEFFTKQAVLWGGEARWNPEPTHQGSFSGEYIHQQPTEGLGWVRRYQYSFKEIYQREDGWQLAADVNQASDALLPSDYGQGIARLGATPFDSNLYLGKSLPWGTLALTSSEQRSFYTTETNSDLYNPGYPNYLRRQVLPSLQGTFYPVPVGSFYLDAGVRVGRLVYKPDLVVDQRDSNGNLLLDAQGNPIQYRPLSDTYDWERDDAFVRFQGRLGQWGPFRADLETLGRYTRYSHSLEKSYFNTESLGPVEDSISSFQVDNPGVDRLLGSARLQLSAPPIGRDYQDVHLLGYSGDLKHVLNPYFAVTTNTDAPNEGLIPHFDEVDFQPGVSGSAAGERSLEFGVKQHFLGRGGQGVPYLDLVRWNISTKYHMAPILLNDGRVLKGWGTIDSNIDVEPNDKLRVSFRRSSDLADADSDQSLSADYKAGDGSTLRLAYFSAGINRLLVRQKGIQLGGIQRLWSDRLRLEVLANYDFQQNIFASSQVALAYLTPCVAWSLRYSHLGIAVPGSLTKEDRLDLVITLRGLGDLGKITF